MACRVNRGRSSVRAMSSKLVRVAFSFACRANNNGRMPVRGNQAVAEVWSQRMATPGGALSVVARYLIDPWINLDYRSQNTRLRTAHHHQRR